MPELEGCYLIFWLHGNGVVVQSCTYQHSTSLHSSGFLTISGNVTRFTAKETQVIVHVMLSLFLSEPAIFPKLGREGRGRVQSTSRSSRGGSVLRGTRARQILITRVRVGHSRGLAFITGLI